MSEVPAAPPSRLRRLTRPVPLDGADTSSMASRGALGLLGTGSQGVLRFATNVLVANLGSKALLGVVQSGISLAMFLSLLWPTTTGTAASTYIARSRGAGRPEQTRAVAAHLALRTWQSSLLLAAASVPVWWSFFHGTLGGGLAVATLLLGYSGYSFTRGVQYGAGQLWRGTMWDVIASSLGLLTILVLLLLGVRDQLLLAGLGAAYGLYALACWPHGARGSLTAELRRELDHFVVLGVAGSIASAGFLQATMLVVRRVFPDDSGAYAAALSLATPTSLLAGTLSLVLVPAMAEAWGRGDRAAFVAATDRATRVLVFVMVAIFGSLAVASRALIGLLYPRIPEATHLLPILLFAILGTTLAVACVNAQMTSSTRGMRLTTIASVVGMIVGSASWLVLAPWLGISGVAWGYLVGTWTIASVPIVATWRGFGHRWGLVMARLAVGSAVAATVAALAVGGGWGLLAQAGGVVGFLVLWCVLSAGDLRTVRAALPRRFGGTRS